MGRAEGYHNLYHSSVLIDIFVRCLLVGLLRPGGGGGNVPY
jgi:hypothetical protein